MDRRERLNSLLVALRAGSDSDEATLWTTLPAIVQSYNATKLTVEAQPTIKAQVRTPGGMWVDTVMPLCVDCPVVFPGGGGFTLTFPIAAGDEGLLIFASRCIDAWWQSGKVSPQAELRMHDLSDGFFFPTGGMSNPKVPGGVSTTTAQLRSQDGSTYLELAAGQIINVVAPGGFNVTGPVKVTGTLEVTGAAKLDGNLLLGGSVQSAAGGTYGGNLETSGNVVAGSGGADQVGLQTHKHPTAAVGAPSPPTPGT